MRGPGAAQAQVREQTLRWTTQNPAGHPITLGGQKFADNVVPYWPRVVYWVDVHLFQTVKPKTAVA